MVLLLGAAPFAAWRPLARLIFPASSGLMVAGIVGRTIPKPAAKGNHHFWLGFRCPTALRGKRINIFATFPALIYPQA